MAVADVPCCVTRTHCQAAAEAPLTPVEVTQLVWAEAAQLRLVHLLTHTVGAARVTERLGG